MKLLLDTQIFLWAITGDNRLTKPQSSYFMDSNNDLYLSVASIWEIIVKSSIGKLPIPTPVMKYVAKQMQENRIGSLPVRESHFAELEKLPQLHRDPFDRMLVAQAVAEQMPILTSDLEIRRYGVVCL